jgi:hypothetical protein
MLHRNNRRKVKFRRQFLTMTMYQLQLPSQRQKMSKIAGWLCVSHRFGILISTTHLYRKYMKNRFSRAFIENGNLFCFWATRASFTSLLTSSKKRSMSQMNMCLECFEPVVKGWKMVHHKKHCRGRPVTNKLTQSRASTEPQVEDPGEEPPQDNTQEVEDLGEEPPQDNTQDLNQGTYAASHVVGVQPARGKLRVWLTPKTQEIIEFLGTAEKGEGCSREHAQGWLDYHKGKGGASASLLPKDIRTCWEHVAKV